MARQRPGTRDVDAEQRPGFSWVRVVVSVGVLAALGFASLVFVPPLLEPAVPYGDGTVAIAGTTRDVRVCDSVEHGVELHDEARGTVLYVAHVGPSEIYADMDEPPARTDGTYLVQPTTSGERWSGPATVDVAAGVWTVAAVFDDGTTVEARYEDGGWCRGADPNVLGR